VVPGAIHELVLFGAVADADFGYGPGFKQGLKLAVHGGFVGGYFFAF